MKITKTMIEAAARAIHHTFADKSGRSHGWLRLMPNARKSYRQEAKAALEAALATRKVK